MSDWTPTTEQVREDFATRMAPLSDAPRREAFDRWLAEMAEQTAEAEVKIVVGQLNILQQRAGRMQAVLDRVRERLAVIGAGHHPQARAIARDVRLILGEDKTDADS